MEKTATIEAGDHHEIRLKFKMDNAGRPILITEVWTIQEHKLIPDSKHLVERWRRKDLSGMGFSVLAKINLSKAKTLVQRRERTESQIESLDVKVSV